MDFDLFELDDMGDELVSSVNWEPTQTVNSHGLSIKREPVFAELHCQGEDTVHSTFSVESFLRKGFLTDLRLEEVNGFSDRGWQETVSVSDVYGFDAEELNEGEVLDYCLSEACMNIQCLMANVEKSQMTFGHNTATASSTISFFQRRHQVTTLWQVLIHKVDASLWPLKYGEHLESVRRLWQTFSGVQSPLWLQLYLANSPKGNESQLAAYHLLHGLLEWKFLDLYLQCKLVKLSIPLKSRGTHGSLHQEGKYSSSTLLIQQFQSLCNELTLCSLLLFRKKRSALELLNSSCFPCTCFKEIWLLILKLLKKAEIPLLEEDGIDRGDQRGSSNVVDLWCIFNTSIDNLKSQLVQYSLTNTNFCLFVNWLLMGLVRLYGYRSNGQLEGATYAQRQQQQQQQKDVENLSLLEKNTQEFLQSQPGEEQLRVYLSLLRPLVIDDWWSPKINIPMQLWEYFHKRLNSVFYVAGSAVSHQLAVTSSSGQAYLERYRTLLAKRTWDTNLSSYSMFTLLMGNCLKRLRQDRMQQQQHQIQKLLGRIYSKFSAQKLLSLNETGIHHLIELLLILALNGDLYELMPKLSDQLLNISLEKISGPKALTVTRGHMALWLLGIENRYDLSDYIGRLLSQMKAIMQDTSQQESGNSPVKILAECLLDIVREADDFERGEKLLIDDPWLPKYLNACSNPNEIERILEALHLVFTKLRRSHSIECMEEEKVEREEEEEEDVISTTPTSIPLSSCKSFHSCDDALLKSLETNLLPFVKQQFSQSYSHWLPKLAAQFCLCAENIRSFQQIFNHFIDIQQSRNSLAHLQFVWKILQSQHHRSLIEPGVIIQVWLKTLVFQSQNSPQQNAPHFNDDMKQLTTFIGQLPEFQEMTGINNPDASQEMDDREILNSKEPLCSFVAAIGRTYSSIPLSEMEKRSQFSLRFNGYLKNFDKWLTPHADLWKSNERTELLHRFYSFMAIVIFHCAPLVYSPAKVSCFLNVVLTRYILPTTVQMGKTPEQRMAQCIHKIWPVLVQGIGRLNFRTDVYINKALTDIIQKWTPHLKISNNPKLVAKPFIKCLMSNGLKDKDLSLFILEKLTGLFLIIQRRQPEPYAGLVIVIFQELLESVNESDDRENLYLIFIQGTIMLILEHIMLVDELIPSRQQLLELLRRLLTSDSYRQSPLLIAAFAQQLETLTRKHLAYHTFYYFELVQRLAQISSQTVAAIMDALLAEIMVVEEKRASGQDAKIRSCYKKLQQLVN